jgi:hypothetical protein
MAVRNSAELGPILNKIAFVFAKDQELCRLLYYTGASPLEKNEEQPDLDGYNLLNKNILTIPEINASTFDTATKICLLFNEGEVSSSNAEFKNLRLNVLIYTPFKSWGINDIQLRPFAVIGRIETLLKNKRVESLGTIKYEGFNYIPVDDNISGYNMEFSFDVFN